MQIRSYVEGDETQIIDLHNQVFPVKTHLAEWQWKYRANPVSSSSHIYVAEDEKVILGHYAGVAQRFLINGKIMQGLLASNLVIHPDYRKGLSKRGLFFKFYNHVYADINRNKPEVAFGYGLPTFEHQKKLQALSKKQSLAVSPLMLRIIDYSAVFNQVKFLKYLVWPIALVVKAVLLWCWSNNQSINIEPIKRFDQKQELFWDSFLYKNINLQLRNSQYLNWRYFDKPNSSYVVFKAAQDNDLLGYIVLKMVQEEQKLGYIVDLLAVDDVKVLKALYFQALKYFLRQGADFVLWWSSGDNLYNQTAGSLGFRQLINNEVLMDVFHASAEDFKDSSRWYITLGDTHNA